jgi:hypothetical protein
MACQGQTLQGLYHKAYYGCNYYCVVIRWVLEYAIHFRPSLTFAGKAGAYHSEIRYNSTLMVGSYPSQQTVD